MSQSATDAFEIAQFDSSMDVAEVAEDTYQCTSFSNVTAFDTAEGLVLIDTCLPAFAPHVAAELREHTDSPVHTAIYTHGHVDHAHALDEYLLDGQEPPTVIAHEAMADRFDRYARTETYNDVINGRQFAGDPAAMESHNLSEGNSFGWPEHPPTAWYSDELTITVGGVTFELHHARGETDDMTWVYCPDRNVLCSGDLVIGAVPNAGNPQKVQRYPWEWADALHEMAATEADVLCPGHSEPIVDDAAEIEHRLLSYADYLDTIVEATLEKLNDGAPPHVDIVREIEFPDSEEPWLQPEYDSPEFIARNVIRYYGGWWSGRPSELKPARRAALAEEIAELVGGAETLASRAEELATADQRLACHLADYALEAAPENEAVGEAVANVYEERSDTVDDLMSANIYASAAEYAKAGRRFR